MGTRPEMIMSIEENNGPDCPSYELIAAFVDHKVNAEQRRQIESHIAYCRDCRGAVAFLIRNLDDLKKFSGR